MADKIYPKGIRLFPKKANQPEFVVGTLLVTIADFGQFIKDNEALLTEYNGQRQLNMQILKGQDGGIYAVVDTWKPSVQSEVQTTAPAQETYVAPTKEDNLPF